MTAIEQFQRYLKDRRYNIEDLGEFLAYIRPVKHPDGLRGYQFKPLPQVDKVNHRCMTLIKDTWSCRDYVKKVFMDEGASFHRAGEIINPYIKDSKAVQIVAYLANENKHASTKDASKEWGGDIAPRLGRPFVMGVDVNFPSQVKPFIGWYCDIDGELEFAYRAGVGDNEIPFTGFAWRFSCEVLDRDGKVIGNAADICNDAYQTWVRALADNGVQV